MKSLLDEQMPQAEELPASRRLVMLQELTQQFVALAKEVEREARGDVSIKHFATNAKDRAIEAHHWLQAAIQAVEKLPRIQVPPQ